MGRSPMDNSSGKVRSGRTRRLLIIGGVIAVLAILMAISAWLLTPRLTENLLRKELAQLETRAGLSVEVGVIETTGLDGLLLRDIEISLPEGGENLGNIDEIRLSVALLEAARGRPAASGIEMEGIHFVVHRRADGSSFVDELLDRPASESDDTGDDDITARPTDLTDRVERLLRHFGGQYPDVDIRDATVEFTHHDDALPWPVDRIHTAHFSMTGDRESAPFSTSIDIAPNNTPDRQLPEKIELSGNLRIPVDRSTFIIDLTPELRIANLSQLPFVELSIAGVAVEDDFTARLVAPALYSRLSDEPHPLAGADRVVVQLDEWVRSPSEISLLEFQVDGARLFLEYSAQGASNFSELYAIARQPSAFTVEATAKTITENIARSRADDDEDDDPSQADDEPQPAPSLRDRLAALPIQNWIANYLPHQTTLRDFRFVVDDARTHENLTRPASHFEVRGDLIELRHRPIQGVLEGKMQFQTEADDEKGRTDIDFSIPYRRGDWNANIDIDNLQLAHLAQLGGSMVADRLHGGEITATMKVSNNGGVEQVTRFDGFFSATDTRVHFLSFAADPVEVPSTSLQLAGYYDPSESVPPPKLIDKGSSVVEDAEDELDEELAAQDLPVDTEEADDDDDEPQPPSTGAFVIEEATARLGEVQADFHFALHGLDGTAMPNRATLGVDLKSTPLSDIIDAIPAALRGGFDGTEMAGALTWKFDLEVPFYEARHMRWNADVRLSPDFKVLYLPDAVDVFKLTDEFEHTIVDEWKANMKYREREVFFERTVQIPAMRPTPATWMLENTPLDLERIDRIRRRRDWPPVPTSSHGLGMSYEVLESPEYWLTPHAINQAAPKPWDDTPSAPTPAPFWQNWGEQSPDDDDDILRYQEPEPLPYHQLQVHIDPERYGEYIYVPLHHISPYLPRAIMTTEDTNFFTHRGFNFLAIRTSVQTNINAGRFVRGASTISMQLAKNLFLDRSRVLSRKLQEVTLVWLMESVADIPKERLMELYLNIIEFGPGVFGIHDASVHYFGKRPDALTVSEVAWLVSIVPSPKRHHAHYDRGSIPPFWFNRMARYIRAMYHRDRITEEERDFALDDRPEFYFPEDGEPLLRQFAEGEPEDEPEVDDLQQNPPDDEAEIEDAQIQPDPTEEPALFD